MARQVYRLRVLGLALGFICIAGVLYEHGASPIVRASLTRISEQSLRAGDIVRRGRQFSRREDSSRERQSLIEAHGGRVGAGPHPGDGSTFFFELPPAQDVSS